MLENDPGTVTLRAQLPDFTASTVQQEILLFIMNDTQPITLKNRTEITLGRKSNQPEDSVVVDLTPYGENKLGVSRKHAIIEYKEGGYLLRDLDSSNGTYLNEMHLIPHRTYHLQSGDRLRLGQLPITVYFKENFKAADTTFYIRQPEMKAKLTVAELSEAILPMLQAVMDIQRLADDILKRTPEELGLQSIRLDNPTHIIRVQTDRPVEIVSVIQDVLNKWKGENKGTLEASPETLKLEPMVLAFLAKIKVDISPEERKTYTAQLAPMLKLLVMSPLEIASQKLEAG